MAAILTGARHEMRTHVTARALDAAGLLDPALTEGFAAAEEAARSLTRAGVAKLGSDLVGGLMDVLA